MSDDKLKEELMARGTSWMLEMELLNSKHIKNFIFLNTYNASKHIKDVEILLDSNYRVLLIYIEIGFLGRLLKKQKDIETYLLEQFQEHLPSFRVRVVFEKRILDLALKKAEEMAKGGTYEKVNRVNGASIKLPKQSEGRQQTIESQNSGNSEHFSASSTDVQEESTTKPDSGNGNPQ